MDIQLFIRYQFIINLKKLYKNMNKLKTKLLIKLNIIFKKSLWLKYKLFQVIMNNYKIDNKGLFDICKLSQFVRLDRYKRVHPHNWCYFLFKDYDYVINKIEYSQVQIDWLKMLNYIK